MESGQLPDKASASGQDRSLHKVISVDFLAEHTYRLSLERNDFRFRAGQCANIGMARSGVNREYSSYSAEQDPVVSFLIRRVDDGYVSVQLGALQPGDVVELDGPYGEFCIPEARKHERFVFIGTGTGIAPFHSFVTSYPELDYRVLHGVRQADECYDRQDFAPDRYVACISQGSGGDFSGRVTDYLRTHEVDREAIYFLCGNRNMINEVYDLLRENRVPGDNLYTETFF